MPRLIAVLAALALLAALGCASQQWAFDSLSRRDKLRFAACRHDVARSLCPDDRDCAVKAAERYAAEPPRARRQFLKDYGCSEDKIRHAESTSERNERRSVGME